MTPSAKVTGSEEWTDMWLILLFSVLGAMFWLLAASYAVMCLREWFREKTASWRAKVQP